MTIGASSGGFLPEAYRANSFGAGFMTIDAADEEAAIVFQIPHTGNWSKVHFFVSLHTTGAILDVRAETVNASGDPSDILLGANSNGSVTTTGIGWYTATFTTPVAVTLGDDAAATVVNPTASFGNMRIAGGRTEDLVFPYCDLFTGTWAKQDQAPAYAIEYDDGNVYYAPFTSAHGSQTTINFNTGSTPDERGNKYVLPYDIRIIGFWMFADLDNGADVVVYNAAGAELTKFTVPTGHRRITGSAVITRRFKDIVDIAAGATFRLVLKPTTGSNVTGFQLNFEDASGMGSAPLGGDSVATERTDAGAWTDTTNERMNMGLIVGGFNNGAGGGSGGMRMIGPGGMIG